MEEDATMHHTPHPSRWQTMGSRRGSLLLWTVSLNLLLLMMVVSNYPFFQTLLRSTANAFQQGQGRLLAEVGIDEGLWYLNRNLIALTTRHFGAAAPFTNPGAVRADLDGDGVISVGDIGRAVGGGATPYPTYWYDWNCVDANGIPTNVLASVATCTRNYDNFPAEFGSGKTIGTVTVTVSNINGLQPQIRAVALIPNATPVAVKAVTEDRTADFRYAAFGNDQIIVSGKVHINSYHSDTDPPPSGFTNTKTNGDIGTNAASTSNPDLQVTLTDNAADPTQFHVYGKAYLTQDTQTQIDPGDVVGGTATQMSRNMPKVSIPASLSSLPIRTTWTGFSGNGNGDFRCLGACVCNESVHVKSIYVTGVLQMDVGCQIYVEKTADSVPFSATGVALDTDGTGQVAKNSTETTQVFIKDGSFDFEGGGATWSSSIAAGDRKPPKFQIYVTGSNTGGTVAQQQLFYGAVYVENGDLTLKQGKVNAELSNGEYYGGFVAGKRLIVDSPVANERTVFIHYDEALKNVRLNATSSTNRVYGLKSLQKVKP